MVQMWPGKSCLELTSPSLCLKTKWVSRLTGNLSATCPGPTNSVPRAIRHMVSFWFTQLNPTNKESARNLRPLHKGRRDCQEKSMCLKRFSFEYTCKAMKLSSYLLYTVCACVCTYICIYAYTVSFLLHLVGKSQLKYAIDQCYFKAIHILQNLYLVIIYVFINCYGIGH